MATKEELQAALCALNEAEECYQPETLEELRSHFGTIRVIIEQAIEHTRVRSREECLTFAEIHIQKHADGTFTHSRSGALPDEDIVRFANETYGAANENTGSFKGQWVTDDNGNRCSVEKYGSFEAAVKVLVTLKDCHNCVNCDHCENCADCIGCSWCIGCKWCIDSSACSNGTNLTRCTACDNCTNCIQCDGCHNCNWCTVCSDCSNHNNLRKCKVNVPY